MRTRGLVSMVIAGLVLAGCGGSSPSTQVGEPGPWEVQVVAMGDTTVVSGEAAPTQDGEQVYQLADDGAAGDWFTETSVEAQDAPGEPVPAASVDVSASPASQRKLSDFTYGFRIQISAAEGSMVLAESLADSANSLFSIPAYVEYERGWYKVRLGDFLTREDASAFMTKAGVREQFDKAFIAETYVLKP